MRKHRILFVDDEPKVLSAIRRGLRKDFDVVTASGGKDALKLVRQEEFSVIVSDCRMPEMDGIEFLRRASQVSPESTRVVLTGNMDQETAVRAVNQGEVFRFITKPCVTDDLKRALNAAIRQYELVTAERELLENTLKGSINVLADVLSIAMPEAFGRTSRLRRTVNEIGQRIEGVDTWVLDAAAMLSQLGCVNVSRTTLQKIQVGEELKASESRELLSHPQLGSELISQIPRMQNVAKAIRYQNKHFDGTGFPEDTVKGSNIPLEARILSVALAVDNLRNRKWSDRAIIDELRSASGKFDPAILESFIEAADQTQTRHIRRVAPEELQLGMIIQEDITNQRGVVLIYSGQEVSTATREHMMKFQRSGLLTSAILVEIPVPVDEAVRRQKVAS